MDEKAARRRPVRHDTLGTNAQAAMGVLLVRGHPAVGVTAPAELGEGLVKPLGQGRQDDLEVKVARPHPQKPRRRRNASSAAAVMSD